MSSSKLEEIKCPCGEVFEAELWSAINVADDPELKEALLSGEINVVCCPSCGQIFYAEHFILYHDSRSEFLAFVYPSSFESRREYWTKKMKEDFRKATEVFEQDQRFSYEPVILFGLDALVRVISEEDEESDEAVILEYLAKELGLSLIALKPSLARPHRIPRVLPRYPVKDGNLREEVIAGLRRLVQKNGHLLHYKKLLQTIEHDKCWTLDKKLVRKEPVR